MSDDNNLYVLDVIEKNDRAFLKDFEKEPNNELVRNLYEKHHEFLLIYRDILIPTISFTCDSDVIGRRDLYKVCRELSTKVQFHTDDEFYKYSTKLDEEDKRDVVDSVDGLSLEFKSILLGALKKENYSDFKSVITQNPSAKFSEAAKYAYSIFALKNMTNNFAKSKMKDFESLNFEKKLESLFCSKIPYLYEVLYDDSFECSDDYRKEILTKHFKLLSIFFKQCVTFFLSDLSYIEKKKLSSKFPKESYRLYQTLDDGGDGEDLLKLLFDVPEKTIEPVIEFMETLNKNNIEDDSKITIDISSLKSCFQNIFMTMELKIESDSIFAEKKTYFEAFIDRLVIMKTDSKACAKDYQKLAKMVFCCEYFKINNPKNKKKWSFAKWYKEFCKLCHVDHNENYNDRKFEVVGNDRISMFIPLLPPRKNYKK